MAHALTHAWRDLTQRQEEEEESQPGACGFGEQQRWQQVGITAQWSLHKTVRRLGSGERVQPLLHAQALRYVMSSRWKGLAEWLARWAGAWRKRAAGIKGTARQRAIG